MHISPEFDDDALTPHLFCICIRLCKSCLSAGSVTEQLDWEVEPRIQKADAMRVPCMLPTLVWCKCSLRKDCVQICSTCNVWVNKNPIDVGIWLR